MNISLSDGLTIGGFFLTFFMIMWKVVYKGGQVEQKVVSLEDTTKDLDKKIDKSETRLGERMEVIEEKQRAHDTIVVNMSKDVGYIRGAVDALLSAKKGVEQE